MSDTLTQNVKSRLRKEISKDAESLMHFNGRNELARGVEENCLTKCVIRVTAVVVNMDLKLECRPDLDSITLSDIRHDLASVANALHTLRESKRIYLGEPAPEILDLSLEKLYRAILVLDHHANREQNL